MGYYTFPRKRIKSRRVRVPVVIFIYFCIYICVYVCVKTASAHARNSFLSIEMAGTKRGGKEMRKLFSASYLEKQIREHLFNMYVYQQAPCIKLGLTTRLPCSLNLYNNRNDSLLYFDPETDFGLLPIPPEILIFSTIISVDQLKINE